MFLIIFSLNSTESKSLDELIETEKVLLDLRKKNEFFHNKSIEVMLSLENANLNYFWLYLVKLQHFGLQAWDWKYWKVNFYRKCQIGVKYSCWQPIEG